MASTAPDGRGSQSGGLETPEQVLAMTSDNNRPRQSVRTKASLPESPMIPRKAGTTTLSHYMLEAMHPDFDMELITHATAG